jgi:hypothetical protein
MDADPRGGDTAEAPGSAPERVAVRRLPLAPVAKFSSLLATAVVGGLYAAFLTLYGLAAASGLVGGLERFVAETLGADSFHVVLLPLLAVAAVLSLLAIAGMTIVGVLVALAYNWYASVFGGLEVDVAAAPAQAPAPARARHERPARRRLVAPAGGS